jgi:hypothetical protein
MKPLSRPPRQIGMPWYFGEGMVLMSKIRITRHAEKKACIKGTWLA